MEGEKKSYKLKGIVLKIKELNIMKKKIHWQFRSDVEKLNGPNIFLCRKFIWAPGKFWYKAAEIIYKE